MQEEGEGYEFHPQNPTSFDFQYFISDVLCEEFQLLFAQRLPPLSLLGLGGEAAAFEGL